MTSMRKIEKPSPTESPLLFELDHRRPPCRCGLGEKLAHRKGSDRIDGGLLDPILSDPRSPGISGFSGQRTSREECARTQIRRFRLSMAAVSALGGFAPWVVSARTGRLHGAFDPSTSE